MDIVRERLEREYDVDLMATIARPSTFETRSPTAPS